MKNDVLCKNGTGQDVVQLVLQYASPTDEALTQKLPDAGLMMG